MHNKENVPRGPLPPPPPPATGSGGGLYIYVGARRRRRPSNAKTCTLRRAEPSHLFGWYTSPRTNRIGGWGYCRLSDFCWCRWAVCYTPGHPHRECGA